MQKTTLNDSVMNTSSKYVHNWIPIVAAARCAKNIPEEVKILNGLISVMEY